MSREPCEGWPVDWLHVLGNTVSDIWMGVVHRVRMSCTKKGAFRDREELLREASPARLIVAVCAEEKQAQRERARRRVRVCIFFFVSCHVTPRVALHSAARQVCPPPSRSIETRGVRTGKRNIEIERK